MDYSTRIPHNPTVILVAYADYSAASGRHPQVRAWPDDPAKGIPMSRRASLIVWIALAVCCNAWADVVSARATGVAYLISHQNGDGSFKSSTGLEIATTATAVDALAVAGVKHGPFYASAIAYLANADGGSVDSQARAISSLRDAGLDTTARQTQLMASRNSSGGWGTYSGFASAFPDTMLALSLGLPVAGSDFKAAACVILQAQRPDWSWSYFETSATTVPTGLSAGAIIPTAYAVSVLNSYAPSAPTVTCGSATYTLATVVSNAVTWMQGKRNASDGGFGDGGTSSILETALVYRALNALATPPQPATSGALTYLLGQQITDGSWRGDVFQTALVLRSFPATTMADTDNDGIPDASEAALHTNPNVPDSRNLMAGNGWGAVGLTAPALAASGQTYHSLLVTLSASGGTPPYTFNLVAGSLPPGVQLSANGQISGTPTASGDYNFDYAVTDAAGTVGNYVGLLSIAAAPPPPSDNSDVPTLPEWGAMLLAGLLLWSALRQSRSGAPARMTFSRFPFPVRRHHGP